MDKQQAALGYFRKDCRMCHSTDLYMFLDFGMHPHSDGFLSKEQLHQEEFLFPLACNLCKNCGQVQLTYTVNPEYLYKRDYIYDASVTATGQKHFLKMASDIVDEFNVPSDSLVIDVGSNVGLLLSGFKEKGVNVLGIDPSTEPTKLANERGIDTVVQCFSEKVATEVVASHGKAAIITGTNVFAHVDDLDDFMKAVDVLLEENGVLIIESPYALELFEHLEYDTIYHQHLSYLSIKPLKTFFERFKMELFNVKQTSIHGGSIRMFIGRKGRHAIQPIIEELIEKEQKTNIRSTEYLDNFAVSVQKHKETLMDMLTKLLNEGKTIVGIGAPAKGMTLLNYCKIDDSILPYTTEKIVWKQQKYTPGTHIPILTDERLLREQPDYALILPWNFADEIMKNLQEFKDNGGKFIIPIPSPKII